MKAALRLIPFFIYILIMSVLVLFEISFLSHFHTLRLIDLSLVIFILVLSFFGARVTIITGLLMALLLDSFSPLSSGAYVIAFLFTGSALTVLLHNVFSDRNIISLLSLGMIGSLLFHGTLFVVSFLSSLLNVDRISLPFSVQWLGVIGATLLANLLALILLFGIGHSVRRFLQKRFLVIRT